MAKTTSVSTSSSTSKSSTSSSSVSRNVLDEALLERILAGLSARMTQEELEAYARAQLEPQKNAEIEAAQAAHEMLRMDREQEIARLAQSLRDGVAAQQGAYRQSVSDLQRAALARGMGRSSYTLDAMAAQGRALSNAVAALTQQSEQKREDLQRQIDLSAEQTARTQGRLEADFAGSMAAAIEKLRGEQERAYTQNYLTAVSAAMGRETTGQSTTTGQSASSSTTTSSSPGGSGSGKKKQQEKTAYEPPDVDVVSGAAPSISRAANHYS